MAPSPQPADDDGWAPVDGRTDIEDRREIIDIEMAEHITHPTRGRLLRRLKHPRSAAELAERLAVPVTRLYHHLKLLETADLIRVVATRKVGAVTERRYQASARGFDIPNEMIDGAPPEQLGGVLGSLFDLAKLDLVEFVERGGMSAEDIDQQMTLGYMQIQLTPARRAELVAALGAMLKEFISDDETDDAEPFAIFVAAFPPDDEGSLG